MQSRESVHTENAPAPFGGAPYSQAMVSGELVFVSGQVGIDPATGALVEGGIGPQTTQVLANLRAVLEAAGSGIEHALKTTVFLTDLGSFGEMNAIYGATFSAPFPARSTFEVSALPAGAAIEIECIAVRS